ncbi:MAG: ATP-dependent RNA helicase HrpA, partial [Gemmatimonadales bacterium]
MIEGISYDDALPITGWHDEIASAIHEHRVVVVAGETGSGKTTQLPKICLEIGQRSIGHTQPRRIAARTVGMRIAEELHVPLGDLVGYQVRFTRKTTPGTRVKVMTDGVLLAEIAHDRDLRRYDTIIVDEAHERSLNIDFLLGYLKQLLTRRFDLKIVVTSATIDTARFAAHFAGPDGTPAPILEVSGRTHPVEVRYRPLLADGEVDQTGGILDAVDELFALGTGDILVFLSGEREIRDAAEAIRGRQLRFTEVLPLYARLSAAEQHRVFSPHPGRRVVLATNVAETSLTVPGIRYVIDAGTARISRYSSRTKVQRLPIEPISQASANQRAGRCGRVAPGVAIRLYSEEDFLGRPEFTEPEILRTNLASVILQMSAADLGDLAAFPFLEPPDQGQIRDGIRLLEELAALKPGADRERPRLSGIGRRLAALPVDPRLGRMLLAAERQGCLREMLVLVSGLSIQDPRERPAEHRDKADALHRRFWTPLPDSERSRGRPEPLREPPFDKRRGREFQDELRGRGSQDELTAREPLREAPVDKLRGREPRDELKAQADGDFLAILRL